MADFHFDTVPTFTLLPEEGFETTEQRVLRAAEQVPIGVVIPALYGDLAGPAMERIIQELTAMDFIKKVYISLDKANFEEFRKAGEIVAPLEDKGVLLWNDSPGLEQLMREVETQFDLGPRGKGRAVWTALGYVLAKGDVSVVAIHDADVLTYDRRFLVRLLYPVVQKRYQFAKGFYVRYADRLYGRVTRLFYFPFVKALRQILSPCEFLDYMAGFRYPLAGEFATFTSLAREMQFPSDWGIEVGMLGEVYRLVRIPRICQVELTTRYDHKHQALGERKVGLVKMASDIARTFFAHLSSQGIVLSREFFNSLRLTYMIQAKEGVNVYKVLTEMHDRLKFDLHEELSAVEMFAGAIEEAMKDFNQHPYGTPLIPEWRRVEVAVEGIYARLQDVLEDPAPRTVV
ncbi:MAG TPA: glucosyl-3-phosphoglycerate synthase [Acidobacteriota bacterium]|nr:glucosyl-3-phosphoglycerate synthase [Acidobacteriota bacterium]